jgi:hypothetical protein
MNNKGNEQDHSEELPIDTNKNFFANELGIRRRGRRTIINLETPCCIR